MFQDAKAHQTGVMLWVVQLICLQLGHWTHLLAKVTWWTDSPLQDLQDYLASLEQVFIYLSPQVCHSILTTDPLGALLVGEEEIS